MGNRSQYRISCVKMVCAECKKSIGCIQTACGSEGVEGVESSNSLVGFIDVLDGNTSLDGAKGVYTLLAG